MNYVQSLGEKFPRLIVVEREGKDIVIAAPHHTPGGVGQMPCPTHTAGDENAGLIAFELAEKLDTSCIIACNYEIDSNKSLDSFYSTQLIKWKPKYLVEIHGHGGKKVATKMKKACDDDCIEVSSGIKARSNNSEAFAKSLETKIRAKEINKNVYGEFDNLHFQASSSATITTSLWTPYHIELPPSIRKEDHANSKNTLPNFIEDFINCLKETIEELCV